MKIYLYPKHKILRWESSIYASNVRPHPHTSSTDTYMYTCIADIRPKRIRKSSSMATTYWIWKQLNGSQLETNTFEIAETVYKWKGIPIQHMGKCIEFYLLLMLANLHRYRCVDFLFSLVGIRANICHLRIYLLEATKNIFQNEPPEAKRLFK